MSTVEERVQRLEDLAAITQVIAAYGPAVDSGSADAAAALFAHDGSYDVIPAPLLGADAIAAMVSSEPHQKMIGQGVAHVMGLPSISLDGDRATAINHSVVFRHRDQAFNVWRVAANRWELQRCDQGWVVTTRVNRLLDGAEEARALLGS